MADMSDFVVALTTLPGDFDATALAQEIVATGLAACVTIVPGIRSVYTWKGVPQVDHEQQLLIKTTTEQVDQLWDVLNDRHPYDVPEFLVVPVVDGSEEYLKWLDQNVGPRAES
jgi:periplasmic divalent cation tolerance protein